MKAIAVILFIVLSGVMVAQASAPAQLSACTPAQQTAMAALLGTADFNRYFNAYQAMMTERNALKGDALLRVSDADVNALQAFQDYFWNSTFDHMPACSESLQFSVALGRGLDEQYIGFLLLKGGAYESALPHLRLATDLMGRIPHILGSAA